MFMLKSLLGRVWNDPNSAEISQISDGAFYLIRPDSVKGSRECIFTNAMAAVRRVLAYEHQFQLVITRVLHEGEDQLLDEDEETDHERAFLIGPQLEFREDTFEGEPSFVWRDLESAEDLFEFVARGTNALTMTLFQTAVSKAIYERVHTRSSENATEDELAEFIYKPPPKKGPSRQSSGSTQTQTVRAPRPTPPSTAPSGNEIIRHSEPAQLYIFDRDEGMFVDDGFDPVEAQIVSIGRAHWLRAVSRKTGDSYLGHEITTLNFRGLVSKNSFNWNSGEGQDMVTYGLTFEDRDAFNRFGDAFGKSLWEVNNGQDIAKLKADEREYILSSMRDVEMKDIDEEEEDVDDLLSEVDEAESEEEPTSEPEGDQHFRHTGGDAVNSQLSVGYKDGRAFVVRGNQIGVFDSNQEDLKFRATIKDVKTLKGKAFAPNKVMLHNQDSSMILMNPGDSHSLYRMDLDRGQVVEEWKVHDDVTIREIAPDSKFAQTTPQQTIVGTSHNALFRIDPRVSGNKLVDGEFKQYATKNAFSSVATTANGRLAVGSEKGDIRLFDSIGKNAKTALPQMGDPIIGVDVTSDGRWLVATCRTYLLLIDTLIGGGRYKGSLGFDRSFPADAKPYPRRLQLKPEHVAYMGSQVSFSAAKFDSGPDHVEHSIVTSSGQFVIAWNFEKVKKGKFDAYEIKQYQDAVVQDAFRFADGSNIIVALEENVLMVDKKALKKPTRTSLSVHQPRRSSAGAPSGIVKQW